MLDFFDKRTLRQLGFLALLTTFSVSLVLLRYLWTGRPTFGLFIWNLFLAWMPLVFSGFIVFLNRQRESFLLIFLFLVPWLLFLPNAPYIVTDFVHLHPREMVPYWYDILLVASFAFHGLLLGFFSLGQVHEVLVQRMRPVYAWALVAIISVGSSYGIYLGRVLRWNSWDILRHPMRIAVDCLRPMIHPFAYKEAIVMTAVLSGLFFLGYLAFQGFGVGMAGQENDTEARKTR
jgi:uncharacterized membrane protein